MEFKLEKSKRKKSLQDVIIKILFPTPNAEIYNLQDQIFFYYCGHMVPVET